MRYIFLGILLLVSLASSEVIGGVEVIKVVDVKVKDELILLKESYDWNKSRMDPDNRVSIKKVMFDMIRRQNMLVAGKDIELYKDYLIDKK